LTSLPFRLSISFVSIRFLLLSSKVEPSSTRSETSEAFAAILRDSSRGDERSRVKERGKEVERAELRPRCRFLLSNKVRRAKTFNVREPRAHLLKRSSCEDLSRACRTKGTFREGGQRERREDCLSRTLLSEASRPIDYDSRT